MKLFRSLLSRSLVTLMALAVVAAGTPLVQCRCPMAARAQVQSAAVAETCCCCHQAAVDQDPEPSCCHPVQTPSDNGKDPAFRHENCQKVLVQPHELTGSRSSNEVQKIAAVEAVSMIPVGDATSTQHLAALVHDPPLPPPVDWQLVLQHFLI